MGKYEAHRLIQREQPLLVLQNQIISIHIIRLRTPCTYGWVNKPIAFLVDGEVTVVGLLGLNPVKVFAIGRFQ